ncbi:hypothetical protein ACVW0J_004988 [Bradyrhizobium sp. i1.7.7]
MTSNSPRPFSVMRHPPFMRSTSPCEKMSRSATSAARRLVRSAQSGPARRKDRHIALEVRHEGETVGIAHQDLQHRDLEIHPPLSSAYRQIVGAPWRASRPTCFSLSREVSPFGFQNLGRHVSAGAGLIARDVFANFVEDGAQTGQGRFPRMDRASL